MKYLTLTFFLCLLFNCSKTPKDSFTIHVNAPGIYNGIHAKFMGINQEGRLFKKDTAIFLNESFSLVGKRTEPSLEYLFIDGCKGFLPVIIENTTIEIDINKKDLITSKISGSKNNIAYQNYYLKAQELEGNLKLLKEDFKKATIDDSPDKVQIYKNLKTVEDQLKQLSVDYIKANKNFFISPILLYENFLNKRFSKEETYEIFKNFPDNLKESDYGKKISKKLKNSLN